MSTKGREATLTAIAAEPLFVQACQLVQSMRYNGAERAALGVAPFELNGLDVSNRVTAGETPFEVALREAVAASGAAVSELYVKTVEAHASASDVESLVALFDDVQLSGDTLVYGGATVVTHSSEEALYLVLSTLKYHMYGEANHVTRALIQRLHTFLFMTVAAAALPFTKGGEPVATKDGDAPSPDAPPLKDLLDKCKVTTDDRNNAVLNEVRKVDAAGLAGASSKLQATVRRQQMSLRRALASIGNARRQFADESKQLGGFIALLAVSVTVFYGWMRYRPELWSAMRVPMAASALVTAVIVLAITGIAIARPVERFEQEFETFCDAAGNCEAAMEDWAAEAAKQAYVSTLDATANLTKRELETRNESLAADLAAVGQRVNATDIEYRDALFRFNRVRQAKRFVVMTLAVALLLMVLVLMGVPTAVWVGLHVAAAVVILLVAVLVYKGNAQRSRTRWDRIIFPGPDDI